MPSWATFSTSTSSIGGGAWQDATGTNNTTGYTLPISGIQSSFTDIQWITVDAVSTSTITNYINTGIKSVSGPTGALINEIYQIVKIKSPVGMGGSQAPFMVQRPWTVGDVKDLYVSYWYKNQADLATQLDSTVSAGNWRTFYEFKTGGYLNTYPGDYRITTSIMKGADNKLYWYAKGDNAANGPWPRVDYWSAENYTSTVPVDKWFKFEAYLHRSSGADVRWWNAVDGEVIIDYKGPNMGDLNLPLTRLFITNPYSGGHTSVEAHMTGPEIWNGFPCGVGVLCYKK